MKKEKLKFSKGFTFLETIVAIFVVSVALVGGLGALTTILKSSHFSYNKLIASYLAQEGIEMVRNVRDTNWLENRYSSATDWDKGLNGCSSGCQIDYRKFGSEDPVFQSFDNSKLKIDSNGFYQYDSGSDTMFSRKITITPQGQDILIVKAEVFWKEGGKDHSVSFQSKLYKYNF